ncbi:hypothetical protein HNY73_010943 [Argiope bruennichi]|uniref:Uncharacterized protein n=1 Tax=Argiope bruennichi TaxID=94029 RepID=A0A8T0F7L0_ARGBR|nr:hypothetical protein HNY73_010943 [Argiope bruennichi]
MLVMIPLSQLQLEFSAVFTLYQKILSLLLSWASLLFLHYIRRFSTFYRVGILCFTLCIEVPDLLICIF